MAAIPKKVETRIKTGVKNFQKIIDDAKSRDVNESDTVTIITDMLADICGYDKYTEITREYAIRNTYCDLAIKLDDVPAFLIEVKAVGLELKEPHLRQALNYAANSGIEWVILTNGDHWQARRVIFGKPVTSEIAFNFLFSEPNKLADLVDYFFLISKEGVKKSAIDSFHEECQLTSRYMIAAALQTETVVNAIRRQLICPGKRVSIDNEKIVELLRNQILKREVLDGDEAKQAEKRIAAALRAKAKKQAAKKKTASPETKVEGS